jgi:hypothetical protein
VAQPADEAQAPSPKVSAPLPRPKPAPFSREPKPTWDIGPDVPPPPPDDGWPEEAAPVKPVEKPTAERRPSPAEDVRQAAVESLSRPSGDALLTSNGNDPEAADVEAPTPDPSPLTTLRPRRLTITLPRSNDQARDTQLLSEAHRLLTSRQGRDRFTFRVTSGGNGAYEIDFPNHSTCYSPNLVSALEKMLGSGTVRVDMQ